MKKLSLLLILILFMASNSFATLAINNLNNYLYPDCLGYGCPQNGPFDGLTTITAGDTITITATDTITTSGTFTGLEALDSFILDGSASNDGTTFMISSITSTTITTTGTPALSPEGGKQTITIQEVPTIVMVTGKDWDYTRGTSNTSYQYDNSDMSGYTTTRNSGTFPVLATTRVQRAISWKHSNKIVMFEISGDFTSYTDGAFDSNEAEAEIKLFGWDYSWIAGQTAPSPGTRFREIQYENIGDYTLLQHLRSDQGDIAADIICGGSNAFSFAYYGYPRYPHVNKWVHVDHVTALHGADETSGMTSSYSNNISLQRAIIGEGLWDYTHCCWENVACPSNPPDPPDYCGPSGDCNEIKGGAQLNKTYGDLISIIDTLYVNTNERPPSMNIAGSGRWFYANNLNFDTGLPRLLFTGGDAKFDIIGNAASYDSSADRTYSTERLDLYNINFTFENDCGVGSSMYIAENRYNAGAPGEAEQTSYSDWSHMYVDGPVKTSCGYTDGDSVYSDYGSTTPTMTPPTNWTNRGAENLITYLVGDGGSTSDGQVGAWPVARSIPEARIASEVYARHSALNYRSNPQEADIDYTALAENTHEITLPTNPWDDDDSDGYLNIQEWLFDRDYVASGISISPQNVSPPNNTQEVSLEAKATFYNSDYVTSHDIWLDQGTCAAVGGTTLRSDDDTDGEYDMSGVLYGHYNTTFCLQIASNYPNGSWSTDQGTPVQYEFVTAGGPPPEVNTFVGLKQCDNCKGLNQNENALPLTAQ